LSRLLTYFSKKSTFFKQNKKPLPTPPSRKAMVGKLSGLYLYYFFSELRLYTGNNLELTATILWAITLTLKFFLAYPVSTRNTNRQANPNIRKRQTVATKDPGSVPLDQPRAALGA
jgi:hypothetical protein